MTVTVSVDDPDVEQTVAPGRAGSAWRATFADGPLVARRRAVADRALILTSAVLVAVVVLLALAVPHVLTASSDAAVRHAVTTAGERATVTVTVGQASGLVEPSTRDGRTARKLANASAALHQQMPEQLRSVLVSPPTTIVASARAPMLVPNGRVYARLVHLGEGPDAAVRWVDGAAPAASPTPPQPEMGRLDEFVPERQQIQLGIAVANAEALGLEVGDTFPLEQGYAFSTGVVSGLFEPVDPDAVAWAVVPDLVGLGGVPSNATFGNVAYLLSDESVPDMVLGFGGAAVTTSRRFAADPAALRAQDSAALGAQVAGIAANPTSLTLADGRAPAVTTELDAVLTEFDARLLGARAQASLVVAGLVGVGALTLVLAARLLVTRRHALLAAERARGSSIASVAARTALESVPLALVGTAVGAAVSHLLLPGSVARLGPALVVTAAAALASPILSSRVAAASWTGQRLPANRRDRERVLGRRRSRRLVLEGVVVLLAAGALAAVRTRGLTQTASGDIDPLLAATPLLLAAAGTLVAMRVLPPLLRAVGRAAERGRGIVTLVASARAANAAGLGIPLLTLATAVALVVFSGITAATVERGQERASELLVGAQARVDAQRDGAIDEDTVAGLAAEPGVTAVAAASVLTGRTFAGSSDTKVTLLMVDAARYASALEGRPEGAELARLAEAVADAPSDAPPAALLSPSLVPVADRIGANVWVLDGSTDLTVAGTTGLSLDGEPLVVVDRADVAGIGPELALDTLWLGGPGAQEAVDRAVAAGSLEGTVATTRDGWLEDRRASPLDSGLLALFWLAGAVLAAFCAVVLVLTVIATAAERGRTLSALRTLGLDRRTARAITWGELVPTTVAALVVGIGVGTAVPLLLTQSLGLRLLTGEPVPTVVQLTWFPPVAAIVVVVGALAVAAGAESLARRRERLGEVLRVGER